MSCSSCYGPTNADCTACVSTYYYQMNACVSTCNKGLFGSDILTPVQCALCNNTEAGGISYCTVCSTVSGSVICSECKPPRMLDTVNNACTDKCSEGYYRAGTYSTSYTCKTCNFNCSKCTDGSSDKCTACFSPYYLLNSN